MDRICNDCGSPFIIDKANRAFYAKKKLPLPCRCFRCRKINRPQLWYVNKETLEVGSVSVLRNAERITILFHNKTCTFSRDVLGTRLFQTYNEAWLAALNKKQSKKKETKTI